ncbi:tRNA preQ1(34) S-adenosylmethionine ribosyltransferase-isomerase QueA [soil metagenome]
MGMKLSQFGFDLPEELLAEYPAEIRDESRLMVLNRKNQTIEHKLFKDVLDYFEPQDVIVLNNTKVFPARLYGNKEKTGARIEVFLLRELNAETKLWDVLVDPARKIRIGNKLYFGDDESLVAEVIDNTTSRGRTLRFLYDGSYTEFRKKLQELGETPLPKYIKREVQPEDAERYQTIYAKNEGAVAAPTAGLHFSKHLLKRLEIKGVDFAEVTLHVGLGTFNPVEVEDLSKHKMDSEEAYIEAPAVATINKAIKERRKVCAVGTTSMRVLESAVSSNNTLNEFTGWTNKFIFPPYDFSIANCMITNFHTPKSTLMMMVSAFAGHDFMKKAYTEAIKEKYKFYTYGDAMLII